jgi:hypothetical protein
MQTSVRELSAQLRQAVNFLKAAGKKVPVKKSKTVVKVKTQP